MKSEAKWLFPSNGYGVISGINDNGIKTFSGNPVESLIREVLQNSLDAHQEKNPNPVVVEFKQFSINNDAFPDLDNFKRILQNCYECSETKKDFFKTALSVFKSDIPILRVSDYNTTGLLGADTAEPKQPWSSLVKELGSSDKNNSSGGSLGIGKAAPFACSNLRTVFYSSVDEIGIKSSVGVARLISHKLDGDDWSQGIGYYSDNPKLTAILEELSFDSSYHRDSSGTDLYICGFKDQSAPLWEEDSPIRREMIFEILSSFLVSLWKGYLVVKIHDDVIQKENLDYWIQKLPTLKEYDAKSLKMMRDIQNYYHILTSEDNDVKVIPLDSKRYGENFGFKDGECTLYVMEESTEPLNNRILMTRQKGMRIIPKEYRLGFGFSGILMIEGDTMNERFKAMENPAHNEWKPSNDEEHETEANSILRNFNIYVREVLLELFKKEYGSEVDAFGMSDFLPDKITHSLGSGEIKESFITRIKKVDSKVMQPSKTTLKKERSKVSSDETGEETVVPKPSHPNPHPPGPRPTPRPFDNHDDKDGVDDDAGEEKGYKLSSINQRLICVDKDAGKYLLKLIPEKRAKKAKLEFFVIGESGRDQTNKLDIAEAKIISGDAVIGRISEHRLILQNIKKNMEVKLEVAFNLDQYSMIGVMYYAN